MAPDVTDQQMKRIEAIINSMTREERRHPEVINANRKRRIARGSGTEVQDINELLSQFKQIKRMMKQMAAPASSAKGDFLAFRECRLDDGWNEPITVCIIEQILRA